MQSTTALWMLFWEDAPSLSDGNSAAQDLHILVQIYPSPFKAPKCATWHGNRATVVSTALRALAVSADRMWAQGQAPEQRAAFPSRGVGGRQRLHWVPQSHHSSHAAASSRGLWAGPLLGGSARAQPRTPPVLCWSGSHSCGDLLASLLTGHSLDAHWTLTGR